MDTILAIVGGVVGVMLLIGILILLDKHTSWFWRTCKVCKTKQEMFFYVGETNAKYEPKLDGCQIGDVVLNGGQQVCTRCAEEHKLFDNYKDEPLDIKEELIKSLRKKRHDSESLQEKIQEVSEAFDNPESRKRIIYHGGCISCVSQSENGIGRCVGCKYFTADWSKPDLSIKTKTK